MCSGLCVECVKWERAIKLLLSERFHPMQAAAEEGKQDNVALLSCCCSCSCSCFRFVCLFHEMAPPHTHPQIHSPSHPPSTTTTTTSSTCENYPANDWRWFWYALLSPAQLVDQLILPGGSLVGIALPDSFHVASQHRRRPYRPRRRLVVRGLALCVTCKPALVKQSSVRSVTTEGDGLLILLLLLLLYIIVGI